MGQIIPKLFSSFSNIFENKVAKIMMIGLDAAGKTTILYKFKLDEDVMTIPTIGFNVETLVYKNITLNMWDIGGQDKIRRLWSHYFEGCDVIIYVVDSSDRDRLALAGQELEKVLEDDRLRNASLLVYANKQDLPQAANPKEIVEILGLNNQKKRKWFVQPSCASNGTGIYEGLDWISNNLPTKK